MEGELVEPLAAGKDAELFVASRASAHRRGQGVESAERFVPPFVERL